MAMFQQMLVMFLLMLAGYFGRKLGIIGKGADKVLSAVVVYIGNPALILSGSVSGGAKIQGQELLFTMGLACGIFGLLILISYGLPSLLRVQPKSLGAYRLMTVFQNLGFMGFPLITAMFGKEALLYGTIFLIPYNVLIYTYGIRTISSEDRKEPFQLKKLFNVGVIACLLTMLIYVLRIPVPSVIANAVTHLSGISAPLSMMVIGASLACMKLKSLFSDLRLLAFSALRLIAIPICVLFVLQPFVQNEMLFGVCLVVLGTPVGSMNAMLAQEYDGDTDVATRGVALTSLLSVLTIPLLALIFL